MSRFRATVAQIAGSVSYAALVGTTIGSVAHADSDKPVRITPFVTYENLYERNDSGGFGRVLSDSYTRLYVISSLSTEAADTAETNSSILPYKSRNLALRYFLGQESSINVTITVTNGIFKATVPLISLDHKSDTGNGEQWTRSVYQTAEAYPLFLIGQGGENATPNIAISLKGNISGKSNAAGSTVSAILGLARTISPTARIVTTLSSDAVKNEADAIDKALSSIYDRSIQEDNITDQDLRYWAPSGAIAVRLYVPKDNFNMSSGQTDTELKQNNLLAGQWFVKFESPRPSIFVDWRMCVGLPNDDDHSEATDSIVEKHSSAVNTRCIGYSAVEKSASGTRQSLDSKGFDAAIKAIRDEAVKRDYLEVDASSVLQTDLVKVGSGIGQIGNYLAQQDFFKADLKGLVSDSSAASSQVDSGAAGKKSTQKLQKISAAVPGSGASATHPQSQIDGAKLSDLCENVYGKVVALKMTTTDARIVLWSIAQVMTDVPQAARDVMLDKTKSEAIGASNCFNYIEPVINARKTT